VNDIIGQTASGVNDKHHQTSSVTELDDDEDDDGPCDPSQVIIFYSNTAKNVAYSIVVPRVHCENKVR